MNKEEQAELCKLLAKMRYDIMFLLGEQNISKNYRKKCYELLTAINRIMSYSYIDMKENNNDK